MSSRGIASAFYRLAVICGLVALGVFVYGWTVPAQAAAPTFSWSECLVLEIPAVPATPDEQAVHGVSVYFDFDRAEIRADDLARLREFADTVRGLPGTVQLSAYTDRRGADDYNDALGSRRLQAVSDALRAAGIDPGRIVGRSWGESRALIEEALSDTERQPDRRADAITVEVIPGDPGRPAERRVLLRVPEVLQRYPVRSARVHSYVGWRFEF